MPRRAEIERLKHVSEQVADRHVGLPAAIRCQASFLRPESGIRSLSIRMDTQPRLGGGRPMTDGVPAVSESELSQGRPIRAGVEPLLVYSASRATGFRRANSERFAA
jgi:hypothetical protein